MNKVFLLLAILSSLFFASCSKDDDEPIIGDYIDKTVDWKFTGKEWQFKEEGNDYSILATTEGPEYFFVVGFFHEELKYRTLIKLYDYNKLESVLPKGYEDPTPVFIDGYLRWVAFHQNDYRDVAIVEKNGKVKTYSDRKFEKGNFYSEVSSTRAFYRRDNYEYTFRLFPKD